MSSVSVFHFLMKFLVVMQKMQQFFYLKQKTIYALSMFY